MSSNDDKMRRIRELQSDRALGALTPDERDELARLLTETATADDRTFELAAAAFDLAASPPSRDRLPASLAAKIERDAAPFVAPRAARERASSTTAAGAQVVVMPIADAASSARDWTRWGGWLAAAAVACVFVGQSVRASRPVASASSTPPASRVFAISPTGSSSARGELSWSDPGARGELRLRDLPAGSYEVWIEDGARGERYLLAAGAFTAAQGVETLAKVAPAIAPTRAVKLIVAPPAGSGAMAPAVTVSM